MSQAPGEVAKVFWRPMGFAGTAKEWHQKIHDGNEQKISKTEERIGVDPIVHQLRKGSVCDNTGHGLAGFFFEKQDDVPSAKACQRKDATID